MRGCTKGESGGSSAARAVPGSSKAGAGRPRRITAAAVLSAAVMLGGCGSVTDYLPHFLKPYRPDVQQGNVITSDMVDQLRPGMTRDQVKFMLGTPLLTDAFHPDQWDYLYYLNPRVGAPQRRNLVVYFKDNRLDHFSSDPMPAESMADNLILGRKTTAPPSTPPKEQAPQATPPASGQTTAPPSTPPNEAAPQAPSSTSDQTNAQPSNPPSEAAPQAPPSTPDQTNAQPSNPPKEPAPQAPQSTSDH